MHKYHALLETIDIDIQLGNLLVPHPIPQSPQDRRPHKQEEESVSQTKWAKPDPQPQKQNTYYH